MGNGDGYAIAKLAAMFGRQGKDYLAEKGNEATFSSFRYHPSVLIGAFRQPPRRHDTGQPLVLPAGITPDGARGDWPQ